MNNNDLKLLEDPNLSRYQKYRLKDPDAYRAKKREYAKTPEQKEKRKAYNREYMQRWKEENRERINQLARESHRRNSHKHIDKRSNHHLKSTYGITLQDKQNMILFQDNKCLICLNKFKSTRDCHVDHNHQTGKVRGVLCHVCNTRLGWYERNSAKVNQYLSSDLSGFVW